ncbi:hypothetical protein [Companilactobacillus sp.]|jgi:hypothetical protein|uniref:hypothetical protein n=1 Tax=Companilactobacillus sp. TaxID=2767905 RepID=UPI0025C0A087|nr:hypothetical protein [Companilactobacillus sp.]MCH4007940.1 hypothetical protein [Companilactobacillus sp.]MCH4051881.1 hypothetical protein [Companilactobacillus sp.]MCH4075883.1 hypothetical protein [Companilactobacillus sp.]MCH4124458.1 hypothetical protein [Companilactobacillus sp.]MCH4132579.1 hypothetical protein [Companilactobacillus sp.]
MTYAVNMIEKDEAPILNLENEGTKGRPYVLKPEENEIKLLGDWRYDRNQDVNIKYHTEDAIDEDDGLTPEKIIKNGKFVQENPYHQSKDDMHNGVPQNWDKTIPLNELGSGLQKISVVAYDAVENVEELDPNNADDEPVSSRKLDENKSKRVSKIESFYVMIPEREEIIPELELKIFRPISGHSESDPYEPRKDLDFVDSIDVSGIVQNKDSSAEQTNNFWLTYQVNGGDEKPLEIPDDVKGNNKPVPWHLKDLDLSEFMTYQGIIPIKFTVRNDFGMVVSKTLYIQMKNNDEHNLPDGTISIYAPGDINFGVKHMAPNSETDAKPSFTENLIVDDHRRMEKRDTPVNISFKTEEFKLKNDSDNILDTQLYWKNRELREQEEYTFENFEKKNRVILNDLFKKNIHLKIKSDKPVKQGHFISEWTWSLTESL